MGDKSSERSAKAFSAIGPLIGLGGKLATAIPGLKKPAKSNVRVSALPIAQAAMGVAAQGQGVGRGGAFLQSLRAAGQAGQHVAGQQLAAQTANEQINLNQTNARNQRLASFGTDMASGVADLGVGLVDAANARKEERLKTQKDGFTGKDAPQEAGSGGAFIQDALAAPGGSQGLPADQSEQFEAPPIAELLENPEIQQQQIMMSLQQEMDGIAGEQIRNRTEAFNQARAINGMPPLDELASIAPDLEFRHKAINFGLDEINRRGGSMLSALVPLSRALGTDLTQIMNSPTSFLPDEDEDLV